MNIRSFVRRSFVPTPKKKEIIERQQQQQQPQNVEKCVLSSSRSENESKQEVSRMADTHPLLDLPPHLQLRVHTHESQASSKHMQTQLYVKRKKKRLC